MTKKLVVGSDQKPTAEQLLEMFEKLDSQTKEIKGQMKRGILNSRHIQALIEHRNPFLKKGEAAILTPLAPFTHDKTKDGWVLLEDVPPIAHPFTLDFVSFLKPGESSVNGDVMRLRAKELNANPGQRDLEWLLENQHLIPESERCHYLVASGTVWQRSGGRRCMPCLGWFVGRWFLGFVWLVRDWRSRGRLVSLRK